MKLWLILTLLLLSACSHNQQVDQLRQEYNSHSYSKYVGENLKTSKGLTKSESLPTSSYRTDQQSNEELDRIQSQLIHKKGRSKALIHNTIYKNNLFTPRREIRQKVTILRSAKEAEIMIVKQAKLATVLTLVLKNNLKIKSHLQTANASLAKYDQISFLDDTLAQYAAFTKNLNIKTGKKKHNPAVSNGFPFPGLLSMKAAIIDQSVKIARLQLKQTVQDRITDTRIAYYELQLSRQKVSIISRSIQLLISLKDQLKDSYSTNTTELNKILDIDIDIEKNRNQHQLTLNKISSIQAQLNTLLNLSTDFKFGKIDKLQPILINHSTQQLIKKGQQNRVEMIQLRSEIRKAEQIIQLSEKRFYPDLSAGYSRFQNQTRQQTGSNATKPTFSTRPIFKNQNFFGMNDAYLTESKKKLQALRTKLSSLQKQTNAEILQLFSHYQSAKNNHSLYQSKVIPKMKTSLEITKNLFEIGDASYLKLINLEKRIQDSRLLSLKATKNMNMNAARLSRVIGSAVIQGGKN